MALSIVIVVALLSPEDISYANAVAAADKCETATSWAEYVGGGLWRGVCGDAEGNEVSQSCNERAELMYAVSGGSDAAYEDAIAECEAGK